MFTLSSSIFSRNLVEKACDEKSLWGHQYSARHNGSPAHMTKLQGREWNIFPLCKSLTENSFSVRWRVRPYPASSSLQAEQSLKSWLAVFPQDLPYRIHCIRTDLANTLQPVSTHLRLNIPIGFVKIDVWDFVLLVSSVHTLCFSHATIAKYNYIYSKKRNQNCGNVKFPFLTPLKCSRH